MNKDKFTVDTNIDLDSDFDPLEDFGPDDDEDEEGFEGGYIGSPENSKAPIEVIDDRPAEERIADLLKSMAPRKKVLLSIIGFCEEEKPVSEVNALVDELQENNFSVYTAANLCSLLEKAGAIERITEEGEAAEDVENEPQVVVVDGVEYLEAAPTIEMRWVATQAGMDAVEADKPLDRLMNLLEEDKKYAVIYKRILTLCAEDGGANTKALGEAVDKDPLVQKPRLYAPHFMDKLEKCDALIWKKTWITTDIGIKGLEVLADISDDLATDTEGE